MDVQKHIPPSHPRIDLIGFDFSLPSLRPCAGLPVKNVLFVCTGNICRSPIAEGLFRH
ncbi:MAG: hypothetical protein M3Y03_03800, partial [Verrucomicrobiota bacterium]|nr:hypothetical protein [Verrucomicrobiota bacterium]